VHQFVVLAPEEHLAEFAEVPAVADDAVPGRGEPGEERRLHRARHRREHGVQLRGEAGFGHLAQVRHVREQPRGQPDDVENQQTHAHTSLTLGAA
jgi:hypothetical protein